jgi:hypothetical protein
MTFLECMLLVLIGSSGALSPAGAPRGPSIRTFPADSITNPNDGTECLTGPAASGSTDKQAITGRKREDPFGWHSMSRATAFNGTRTLTGRVLDHHDRPLERATVYLKNTKSLEVETYVSDSDGSYRFPGLSPEVDYEVYAEFQGARSEPKTLSAFDDRKRVNFNLLINTRR